MLKKMLLMVLILSVFTTCAAEENPANNDIKDEGNGQLINHYDELGLIDEEIQYLSDLKSQRKLRVALRETPFVYYIEDGESKGFHYSMVEEFANMFELELEPVITNFQNYWTIDNIVPDEIKENDNFSYTPDLINDVHIYTDNITVLPWREKLVDFITIHPIREVLIHKKDLVINDFSDLDGLRAVLMLESSSFLTLEKITTQTGYVINISTVEDSNDRIDHVDNNLADFTVLDINRAVIEVEKYDTLKVGIPISDVKYIGWAVKKDNDILASILNKYFHYIKVNGQFDDMWSAYYPIDFIDYMKLLSN